MIFEKSITRDWPLIIVQMLHRGFINEFKEQFAFSYSEVLFDFHENYVDIYRMPEEHIEKMRDFILNQLVKDPDFIKKCSEQLLDYYNQFSLLIKEIDKLDLAKISNKELLVNLNKFIDAHAKLEPTFVINFWFPIQMEDHADNKKLFKQINIASETRKNTEKVGPEGDRISYKLINEISQRIFKNVKYVRVLRLEEIVEFLKNNIIPKKDDLEKRLKGFVYGAHGIRFISIEEYARTNGYEVRKKEAVTKEIISGTTACLGLVRGKVRNILSKKNINELKDGEVLVTAMTTPEFLPAMKKAVAFVTDEGGITCHAAIVARELKKPCVIGTKIATQILKDGDEVDATKGLVKIIKKA